MSISDLAFAFPKRHTITLVIPQCFTDIIEYIYKLPYDDVVDAMQFTTIKDDIQLSISGGICAPHVLNSTSNIVKVVADGGTFPIFSFHGKDGFGYHYMRITAYEKETIQGIIAWILLQSNSFFLDALSGILNVYGEITPYYAIDFIAKHKDEDALYALCSYAYTQNEFNVLIDRLARSNAVEETALALRWNRDMIQANISAWNNQQDKFEL